MSQPTHAPNGELDLNDPQVRAWFQQHLTDLRRDAYGPRLQYQVPVIAFVVGFAANVAGYLLKSSAPAEPLGLLADLVYTFGFALWTAAVVVVLLEVIPQVKRRQIRHALEAYEAAQGDKARQKDAT